MARKVIATYTPGYAFYVDPGAWGAFEIDVNRFARLLSDQLEPGPSHLITNPTVADVLRMATCGEVIAVDIETAPEAPDRPWTGKDPTRARLRTVGLGCKTWGLSHKWGDDAEVELAIETLLADERIPKILHNGSWFDLRVLKRYGIEVRNVEDTRDARRSLSATSRLALAHLGALYSDLPPWKESEEDDEKGLVFTDDYEELKRYNAMDCVVTARVWRGLTNEPDWNDARTRALYKQHRELARITAEMHDAGIYVNQPKRWEIRDALMREELEARTKLMETVNMPAFRATPDDLRALIFKAHETPELRRFSLPTPVDPDMLTDKGECAVNRQALLSLLVDPSVPEELKAIIDMYWAVMKPIKYRTTFVQSDLVDQAIGADGRLRPGWNSCGTDTGRFSCSQPNVMNVKQHIRHMYSAGPGNVLVHGDFSQLEIRVMCYVAEDTTLEQMLATGDVYTEEAKAFFKQIPRDATKETCPKQLRQCAKIIRLASQYAASTPTAYRQAIAMDRGMKYAMVATLQKKWKQVFHRTVAYWNEEMERVRLLGYSESRIMGRRRTYPREPRINEVVNYPIQSTAADIANLALLELDAQLKKNVPEAKIIIQLHDAFDVECPARHQGVVKRIMEDVMSTPRTLLGLQRSFPVEIKAAESWGDL